MYTTVNAPVVQTLFINLEHVHECRQIDKIKHGLEHFTSKQNPSHMWKGNPMTSGPTFLLPHCTTLIDTSFPINFTLFHFTFLPFGFTPFKVSNTSLHFTSLHFYPIFATILLPSLHPVYNCFFNSLYKNVRFTREGS